MAVFANSVSVASQSLSYPMSSQLLPLVRPARRGERKCLCSGVLQECKGHYGWILARDAIDHPDAEKHQGGVYLDTRDIRRGSALVEGDEVMFYLYRDSRGLGAEDCHLKIAYQPKQPSGPTLSLADLLDDDVSIRKSNGKKDEAEAASDTASTASGTHSGASSPRSDFEDDPILRMLLQPRVKNAKVEAALECLTPMDLGVAEACGASPSPSSESQDAPDDLMSMLRSELHEARARAGLLAKKVDVQLPHGFAPPPGLPAPDSLLVQLGEKLMEIPHVAHGIAAPPGLPARSAMDDLLAELDAPSGLEAPPGLAAPPGLDVPAEPSPPGAKGFVGLCKRLRMPRFMQASDSDSDSDWSGSSTKS